MKLISTGIANGSIAHVREHSHPYDEIIVTLSGNGTTVVGGERWPFQAGSIECIPARMVHAKYAQERFRDVFVGVEHLAPLKGHLLLLRDDAEGTVKRIALMILHAHHRPAQARVVEALVEALCEYIACISAQPDHDDELERFKNYIIENCTAPDFKIGDTGEMFGYCTDHLRRKFKRDTGMTPVAYLNHLRLEYARRNVDENCGGMPVANLALMSGFYDAHYFARLFKRHTGLTPTQYMAARCGE